VDASLDWAIAPAAALTTTDAAEIAADAAEIAAEVVAAADVAATVAATEATKPRLSDHQRAILDFERQWFRRPGAKEQAIRDLFDMSPTRYYQALNALLDIPEAHEYDAVLVKRLQRLRAAGLRTRSAR
jgi:hypothetical protein